MVTRQQIAKRVRLHILVMIAAIIACYFSYESYATKLQTVQSASLSLDNSRKQSAAILATQDQPTFVATVLEDLSGITERIQTARQLAGISEQAVDLVDPRKPIRIGESEFRHRPVGIDLRGLSLTQVVRFIDALSDKEKGMWVSELRLSPVRQDQDDSERWNAKLILTQVNYSPTNG